MRRLSLAIGFVVCTVGCNATPAVEGTPPAPKPKPAPKPEPELPPGPSKPSKEELAKARKRYLKKLNEGRTLTKAKKYAEGIATYREALEVDPDDPTLLAELGWAAFLSGDLQLARRTSHMALRYARSDRQRGMLLYNLGRIAEEDGMKELAAGHYRASLERRDNETVKKRLAALDPPEPPEQRGIAFIGEGLADLGAVCTELKTRCDEVVLFDPEEHCSCEVVAEVDAADPSQEGGGGAPVKALLVRLGDPGEWDGMNFALHLAVFGADGKLALTDFIAWSYNPGAFGIWEQLEAPKVETRQLVPGGPPEFLVELSKSRMDRDMGINEVEDESSKTVVVCAVLEGKPRCTEPLVRSHSYTREIEFEDEDEAIEHTEGLPIRSIYEAAIEFDDVGKVSVRSEGKADEEGFFDGRRLAPGEYSLLDLL
jgi:tetratricopeptide (TPR) repeat protein